MLWFVYFSIDVLYLNQKFTQEFKKIVGAKKATYIKYNGSNGGKCYGEG